MNSKKLGLGASVIVLGVFALGVYTGQHGIVSLDGWDVLGRQGRSVEPGPHMDGHHKPVAPDTVAERTTEGFAVVYESMHDFLTARVASLSHSRARQRAEEDKGSLRGTRKAIARDKAKFRELFGVPNSCSSSRSARLLSRETIHADDHVSISRLTLSVCGGDFKGYGLLGLPVRGEDRLPLVLAIHGTAASPERIFGLDDAARYETTEYHHEFARRLVREGFAVYAPQVITEIKEQPVTLSNEFRNELDMRGMAIGHRLHGLEIGGLASALDYLTELPRVDGERVGAYGISLGGATAFYLAVLDRRVTATVVSQWIEDRDKKLMGFDYETALWRYPSATYAFIWDVQTHFDIVRLASFLAPRKLFIEAGVRDGERAADAHRLYPKFEALYASVQAPPGSVCFELADAGHEIIFNNSVAFLRYWLTSDPAPQVEDFCHVTTRSDAAL